MVSIRQLLLEAPEEVSLPKQPVSAAPATAGAPMSQDDFAPAPPPTAAPGMNPLPTMHTGAAGPSTVQKEVLNKQLMLAITGELKSMISTYEKKFESEDFTIDDAKIYIHNFLESLAFHADKIANLIGEDMPDDVAEDMPVEAPLEEPPMPDASIEEPAPVEVGSMDAGLEAPLGDVAPSPELTDPNPYEPSPFTNPSEAI